MDYQIWYCANCKQDRESTRSGRCTNCGSSILTTKSGFDNQEITLDDFGLAIVYGPQRPWQEQWIRVKNSFERLQGHYEPGSFKGHIEVWRDVMDFHAQCYAMGDWLWHDPALDLEKPHVKKFMLKDDALKINDGIVNASKHHTRPADKLTATVYSVSHNNASDAARALVSWRMGEESRLVDALDLATRCMTAWQQFFETSNLSYIEYFLKKNGRTD